MQQLWNRLMRTNAKALFIACLLALLLTAGWRGYVEYDAVRAARQEGGERAPVELPAFEPHATLGLLDYVDEQARANSLALPVDLFRPSLDAMVSNLVEAILNDPELAAAIAAAGGGEGGAAGGAEGGEAAAAGKDAAGNLFDVDPAKKGGAAGGGAVGGKGRLAREPKVVFNGVFKRTDGEIAVWITEENSRSTRVYSEGDELFGAKLESMGVDTLGLRLPDGTLQELTRGGSLTLPAPEGAAPATETAAAPAAKPTAAAPSAAPAAGRGGGRRGERGLFRRGDGTQRLPTPEEMAALERNNPELAKRIRNAIEQRRQREKANP